MGVWSEKMETASIHVRRPSIAHPKAKLIHPDNPINCRKSAVSEPLRGVASTMGKPFSKAFSGDTP